MVLPRLVDGPGILDQLPFPLASAVLATLFIKAETRPELTGRDILRAPQADGVQVSEASDLFYMIYEHRTE